MDKLTKLGTELAILLRREHASRAELRGIDKRIRELTQEIQSGEIGTLYPADPQTEKFSVPAHVVMRKNADPVPLRHDHQDGGSTFALTPIADVLTSGSGSMSAIVPCPGPMKFGQVGMLCEDSRPHVHTADGIVHPTSISDL